MQKKQCALRYLVLIVLVVLGACATQDRQRPGSSIDLSSPGDDSLIDRVIADKFRLCNCVGTGAYGAVYQADQMMLGRTVAVKILKPELADDPRVVSRFHDEALAASRLNHPNTVAIIDYGQTRSPAGTSS